VGRKSGGVSALQRLLLDDPAISREHLELRLDGDGGVLLTDESTNGTRVNGRRAEPGEPVALRDGDLIEAGSARLGYRSLQHPERIPDGFRSAAWSNEPTLIASVAGDIVGSTAMAGADATQALLADLRELLAAHGATASASSGDSLFAAWDGAGDPEAIDRAVRFAVAANAAVAARAADGDGDGDGDAVAMGWGVAVGDATQAHTSTTCQAVHEWAANLAFRLSGLAARAGEPAILVSAEVADAAPTAAAYGDARKLDLRGRPAPVSVRAAEPAS
jgi:predicted component of type VI protein secretion system